MASQSVQPFLHSSWQSFTILYMGRPSLLKLPLQVGDLDPHLTRCLAPITAHNPNGISIGIQPFLHRSPQSVLILYNGLPLPPQNCPVPRGIWTPSNTWFHPSPQPKQHLNQFSSFCRAHYCDRLTDHAAWSVTVGRIYIRSTAMRPNKYYTTVTKDRW